MTNAANLASVATSTSGTINAAQINSTTSGTPPVFSDSAGTQQGTLCRAWVNFGYVASAVSVRASFNVSSVVRNSTGLYTINFTNAFSDTNYSISGACGQGGYNGLTLQTALNDAARGTLTTSATQLTFYVPSGGTGAGLYDPVYANISVFR